MIYSMTAFSRESSSSSQSVLSVELRSVNHRYLDISFKMPEQLRALEPKLRDAVSKQLSRGKVECFIRLQSNSGAQGTMAVNEQRLSELLQSATYVAERCGADTRFNPLSLLQFPGIYGTEEMPEDALHADTLALFSKALEGLSETRAREGEKLAGLISDRIVQVQAHVAATRAVLPQILLHLRERITNRIAELDVEVDESRLEQELVFLAQKADVDEELDRLETHVEEVRRALEKGGPCGRRLDFLMQELNREANTLSSKSQSATTTLNAVELKVLIEQMREQIQNIE